MQAPGLKALGPTIEITRLDAARRQLGSAIELWFAEGDPVSVHTLVCAAHQLIHDINRDAKGPPLLFDSPMFRKETAKIVIAQLKEHQNFFKHADHHKGRKTTHIKFDPLLSDMFFLAAIIGLKAMGHALTDTEDAFLAFRMLTGTDALGQHGRHVLGNIFNSEQIEEVRRLKKREFLHNFLAIRAQQRGLIHGNA